MIINPGSHISHDADNTYQRARQYADEWLATMATEGFGDIEMVDNQEYVEGRWHFHFRHRVTGVTVTLEQHGIDTSKNLLFTPRVYWNGSSSSNPSMDDFAAPGYVMTFRPND